MVTNKPRRWTIPMYCETCGKQETVRYTSIVRSSVLADAARKAAGWNLNAAGLVYHANCPKKAD